ncbi:M56 family metallopeptidase [Paenibacillus sp. M1]|uniref:M56 family metallopeptidase n=1 Tax=Paenibacillus haidiansis TaxID=1574488 RepID=A0ABU7VYQ0_9BACL
MTDLFLMILNMSITASFVALAVILARFLLRRAPKIFSYVLWSAVLIRLVVPVSFTASFSLFAWIQPSVKAQTETGIMELVPQADRFMKNAVIDRGVSKIRRFGQCILTRSSSDIRRKACGDDGVGRQSDMGNGRCLSPYPQRHFLLKS